MSDNSAGKQLLSAEIVEDQFAVQAERPDDVLHGRDARAHHLATSVIEELFGPYGRVVIPELLKGFLKNVST